MSAVNANPRKVIRDAAKAALVAANTRAGTRVESNRPNPLSQRPSPEGGVQELPAIIIYTRSTKSSVYDESPRRYRHEAELAVECALEILPDQDIDTTLDEFEQEIVEALLRDETLGGVADDMTLQSSANTFDESGAKLLGAVIITFTAVYYTEAPAQGTQTLADLSRIHTEHSLGGEQPDPRDRAITDVQGLSA